MTEFKPSADLDALERAVANSPIMVPLAVLFANWETVRKSADVDAAVLAWIASHRARAPRPETMH